MFVENNHYIDVETIEAVGFGSEYAQNVVCFANCILDSTLNHKINSIYVKAVKYDFESTVSLFLETDYYDNLAEEDLGTLYDAFESFSSEDRFCSCVLGFVGSAEFIELKEAGEVYPIC